MDGEHSLIDSTSQLQEAIVTIVQTFEYPSSISIEYEGGSGTKRTEFSVTETDGDIVYELVFGGSEDEAEPELFRID